MALFMGPDADVTPAWYAAKQEHGKVVPTWSYVAVQAYGTAAFDTLIGFSMSSRGSPTCMRVRA